MNISRRSLLSAVAAAPLLSACAATIDQNVQNVISDVNILANGLRGMIPQLTALNLPGLTSNVMGTVDAAIAGIQSVAAAVSAVTTTAAAQPLIQKIETYLNTIVGALAPLALLLPPPIGLIVTAATILLPVIEIAVGLLVNNVKTMPVAASRQGAARVTMTADQARIVLRGNAVYAK
jgi:hypothetical protein